VKGLVTRYEGDFSTWAKEDPPCLETLRRARGARRDAVPDRTSTCAGDFDSIPSSLSAPTRWVSCVWRAGFPSVWDPFVAVSQLSLTNVEPLSTRIYMVLPHARAHFDGAPRRFPLARRRYARSGAPTS